MYSNRVGISPDGKNSDDKIHWILMDTILPNPNTQLVEFAITLLALFTVEVQQVGFRLAKAARFQEQLEPFYDLLWLQPLK